MHDNVKYEFRGFVKKEEILKEYKEISIDYS